MNVDSHATVGWLVIKGQGQGLRAQSRYVTDAPNACTFCFKDSSAFCPYRELLLHNKQRMFFLTGSN
jgi:hypothetical protein